MYMLRREIPALASPPLADAELPDYGRGMVIKA
jgi:hypothetical protein